MIETRRLKNVAIFIQTNMHYTCIARITIDLVLRIDKKIIGKFIWKNANVDPKNTNVQIHKR